MKYGLFVVMCLLHGCGNKTEFHIPDDFFSIPVELVNYDKVSITNEDGFETVASFDATYVNPPNYEHHSFKKNGKRVDDDLEIVFSRNGYSYHLFVRKLNDDDDDFRAFYYRRSSSSITDYYSPHPKFVETNVDAKKFDNLFEYNYECLSTKAYRKIHIDFNYDMRNYEFFERISFVE